ncbi:MAG: SMC-Scp complex subunit ScpB [Thermoguttaceae bacterium]|nr:SMC-Scp complex subunit ScpB [Thermoguttaceae bacterium]
MREDAQTGEERLNRPTAQDGEATRNGRTGRTGEGERLVVAPSRFRVVAPSGTISVGGNDSVRSGRSSAVAPTDESERRAEIAFDESNETEISLKSAGEGDLRGDAEPSDDEFDDENAFFASFSTDSVERRAKNSFDDAFAGGLRSIFDAESEGDEDAETAEDGEADEDDASDAERFQRDFERERRESLDGVLLQNDADFLREAGEKYERSRVSDADFERKGASRSGVGGSANGRDGENRENGESVEASRERRVPIGPASILEAMLFVGDRENRPLTLARATELMRNVSETEAIEALADLNERYWRDGAPYRIVRDGDGFRMALRPEFDALAARFVGGKTKEFKLTQTMIDVLALIAYRQPISLDEILETRNNAAGALSQLVKREIVAREQRVVDKKKVAFYSTTPRFLRLFNLKSLDDLPIVGDVDYR